MATILKCRCGQVLSVPESAIGKRGKCTNCATTFVIPAPNSVVPSSLGNDAANIDGCEISEPDPNENLSAFDSEFNQLLDQTLQESAAAARAGTEQPQVTVKATPTPPRWSLLQVIRRVLQSIAAGAIANSRPEPNNTCYKCDGLGLQFSTIDGKQSKCEWCNGTGIVERYYADTADEIVGRAFLPKEGRRRGWRRWQ